MKLFHWKIVLCLVFIISACSPQTIPTPTETLRSISTTIPQTFTVTFNAFHDFNGNGFREESEQPLEGIELKIGDLKCLTNSSGICNIANAAEENQVISISDNRDVDANEKMRFIFPSISEIYTIEEGLKLKFEIDNFIPLGHGYLTLPYEEEEGIKIISYEDLLGDSFDNKVRDWRGITRIRTKHDGKENSVYDWHPGWDVGWGSNAEKCNMFVYAAAPGKVVSIGSIDQNGGGSVRLAHVDGRKTDYAHLGEIFVSNGQTIKRGQLLGSTFCGWDEPHLHWELMGNPGEGRLQWNFWRLPICKDPLDINSQDFLITNCSKPSFAQKYFK